jgi:hypothetical protein
MRIVGHVGSLEMAGVELTANWDKWLAWAKLKHSE